MKFTFKTAAAALALAGFAAATPVLAQDAKTYVDDEASMAALKEIGQKVYTDHCAVCHGANGEGGGGPGLDGTTFMAGRSAIIFQILFGATDHGMPAFKDKLNDEEVAAVSTYIRNTWSNAHGIVLPRSVEMRRSEEAPAH